MLWLQTGNVHESCSMSSRDSSYPLYEFVNVRHGSRVAWVIAHARMIISSCLGGHQWPIALGNLPKRLIGKPGLLIAGDSSGSPKFSLGLFRFAYVSRVVKMEQYPVLKTRT